jgi:NitT/TauT family transport system substrate-binding protein
MRKRVFLAAAGLSVAALILAGCSSPASSASAGSKVAAGKAATLTIGVPGNPPIYATLPLAVAAAQGYFKDQNLNVTIRPFSTGVDVSRALQSSQIEGGLVPTNNLLAVDSNGGSVVGVFGFPLSDLVLASTDPAVKNCKQLKGQTVAIDATGASRAIALNEMLASCGLKPTDVSTIAVGGPPAIDALVSGQVKLAIVHIDELAAVQAKRKASSIMSLSTVSPLDHYIMLSTTRQTLDQSSGKDTWVRVVRATQKAIAYMYDPKNAKTVAKTASDMIKQPTMIAGPALPGFEKVGVWPKTGDGLDKKSVDATIKAQTAAGNVSAAAGLTYDKIVDPSVAKEASK